MPAAFPSRARRIGATGRVLRMLTSVIVIGGGLAEVAGELIAGPAGTAYAADADGHDGVARRPGASCPEIDADRQSHGQTVPLLAYEYARLVLDSLE